MDSETRQNNAEKPRDQNLSNVRYENEMRTKEKNTIKTAFAHCVSIRQQQFKIQCETYLHRVLNQLEHGGNEADESQFLQQHRILAVRVKHQRDGKMIGGEKTYFRMI